jgi:hypothetical protein
VVTCRDGAWLDWHPLPAGSLVLPAPTDEDGKITGPAVRAPGVSLVVGLPTPKATASIVGES